MREMKFCFNKFDCVLRAETTKMVLVKCTLEPIENDIKRRVKI